MSGVRVQRAGSNDTELPRYSTPPEAPATKRMIDTVVVKRPGTPENVARFMGFQVAPENGFITGKAIVVGGGTALDVAPA